MDDCPSILYRLRLEVRVRTPKSQLLLALSAEGYKFVISRGVEFFSNFCLMTTLTLILTLGLTALNLTLTDPHGAFESFCAPIFCDFIRNYYMSELGHIDTSFSESSL